MANGLHLDSSVIAGVFCLANGLSLTPCRFSARINSELALNSGEI